MESVPELWKNGHFAKRFSGIIQLINFFWEHSTSTKKGNAIQVVNDKGTWDNENRNITAEFAMVSSTRVFLSIADPPQNKKKGT